MPAPRLPQDLPSVEYLLSCLDYRPETGELVWKHRPREHFKNDHAYHCFLARFAGKVAGSGNTVKGYRVLHLDGQGLTEHRVIWAMATGAWPSPELQIDHIDLDKANNRIENLTLTTNMVNCRRQTRAKNNVTGVVGVSYHIRMKRWVARIMVDGRAVALGSYKTFDEAVAARQAGSIRYGFAPNHGVEKITKVPETEHGRVSTSNSSGVIGCHFDRRSQQWIATISVEGRRFNLGYHDTLEQAAAARKAAELRYGVTNRSGRGKVRLL